MKAPAVAIAAFVHRRGGASSGEILERFDLDRWTLRRRRPELRLLGVEFVERGRGSFYVPTEQTRSTSVAEARIADTAGHSVAAPDELDTAAHSVATTDVLNCTCRAYAWPHRLGGGVCRWPDEPEHIFARGVQDREPRVAERVF